MKTYSVKATEASRTGRDSYNTANAYIELKLVLPAQHICIAFKFSAYSRKVEHLIKYVFCWWRRWRAPNTTAAKVRDPRASSFVVNLTFTCIYLIIFSRDECAIQKPCCCSLSRSSLRTRLVRPSDQEKPHVYEHINFTSSDYAVWMCAPSFAVLVLRKTSNIY